MTFLSMAVPPDEIFAHSDGVVQITMDMWLCMQRDMDEHLICAMPKHTLKNTPQHTQKKYLTIQLSLGVKVTLRL